MSMKVAAPDGTVISVIVEGAGPPLMLVCGSGDDHTRYGRVAPALGRTYTLYNVDRRGRGASTDAPGFTFAAEIVDLLAVIDAIHAEAGPIHMLAHSYGALLGLEAAWRSDKLKSVLLYEPPMPYHERIDGIDPRMPLVLSLCDRLAQGDTDGMLTLYLRDFLGAGADAVERQKANPKAWQRWLSVARTIPRELLAVREYQFTPQKFADFALPLGVLVGTKSNPGMIRAAQRIKAGIAQAQLIELPGEGHSAMTSSPEMFASAVLAFLNGVK